MSGEKLTTSLDGLQNRLIDADDLRAGQEEVVAVHGINEILVGVVGLLICLLFEASSLWKARGLEWTIGHHRGNKLTVSPVSRK